MFALILDMLLAVLAVSMLIFARFGVTRQAALIPMAMAVLDASFYGLLSQSGLAVACICLQVLVLAVSGLMLYRDVVRSRNKQARRARRQEVARSRAAFERALEQKNAPARRRTVCA